MNVFMLKKINLIAVIKGLSSSWHVLDSVKLRKVLSISIYGRWLQLKIPVGVYFIARRNFMDKEDWYQASFSVNEIQNILENSSDVRVMQIGVFIGEWDEEANQFSLSVGGLFALAPHFHPVAIARHEKRFLSGNVTTADNVDELRGLDERKSIAVSSRHGVLLGLARVKSMQESKDIFLEPIWTTRTTFQKEWREKKKTGH